MRSSRIARRGTRKLDVILRHRIARCGDGYDHRSANPHLDQNDIRRRSSLLPAMVANLWFDASTEACSYGGHKGPRLHSRGSGRTGGARQRIGFLEFSSMNSVFARENALDCGVFHDLDTMAGGWLHMGERCSTQRSTGNWFIENGSLVNRSNESGTVQEVTICDRIASYGECGKSTGKPRSSVRGSCDQPADVGTTKAPMSSLLGMRNPRLGKASLARPA